jgi:hypothetical protein
MCNQNFISNKFDLIQTTTLSSYWCTAIFTKSRSLHYVLKKVEKTYTKVNYTEEDNAFQIDHARIVRNDKQRSTKQSKIHSPETTRKRNSKRFQNNVNKHFQTTRPTTLTNSEQRI